jgi:hypothetical protein
VGQALLARQLVARSGLDLEAAVDHWSHRRQMNHPQSVVESIGVVCHISLVYSLQSYKEFAQYTQFCATIFHNYENIINFFGS